jgi:hypothetical protein
MSHDVKYIGMDVHKEAIVIAVLNESGKLVMESVIETKASSILQFLHGRSWMFTDYAEVVQLTRSGEVVPIETVDLTQHVGFWEAVDDGMDNLRSKREFSSMIDVQYARTNKTKPVTPLPLLGVTP